MNREQIEFAISRFLDGDLSAEEAAQLEAVLASDPAARKLCDELRAVNQILKSLAGLPTVNWDRLAHRIAASAAEEHPARGGERPAIRLADDKVLEDAVVRAITGDITKAEEAELERRSEVDSAARELLAQHRALDVALQHSLNRPEIDEQQLARQIGNAAAQRHAEVADCTVAGAVIDEPLEQAIVSLVDGDLTIVQEAELAPKLAADPAARKALKDHRALEVVLKHGQPLPHVAFELLGQRISEAVAEADAAANRTIPLVRWMHNASRIAVAACVILGVGLLVRTLIHPATPGSRTGRIDKPAVREIVAIDIRPAESTAPRVIEISVGPSERITRVGFDYYAAGAVVSVPARIQIAERIAPASADDVGSLPY